MSDYSQRQQELGILQGWSPDEERALVQGASLPEKISEFKRSRDSEEARLQQQIANAQQMAFSPMNMNTNSTPAAVASIVANALRSFGGMALAGRGEKQLSDAQAESKHQYEGLMDLYDKSTGAGIATRRRGLQSSLGMPDALRSFGGEVPYYLSRDGK